MGRRSPAPAIPAPTIAPFRAGRDRRGRSGDTARQPVLPTMSYMPRSSSPVAPPPSPTLSASQLARLAELGEERTANAGDLLYRVGDRDYPFIVIVEGEVAILDSAGNEIVRHGASGFLGELNLLSGQTVFVTAVATEPLRYIAVPREVLRTLLYEDGPLGDVVLSAFISRREALQRVQGIGVEIVGPHSSKATMRMLDFARSNRLPLTWRNPEHADDPAAAALVADLDEARLPVVRLPGGAELQARRPVRSLARWESAASSRRGRKSICSWSAPAQPASAPPYTAPP